MNPPSSIPSQHKRLKTSHIKNVSEPVAYHSKLEYGRPLDIKLFRLLKNIYAN